MRCIFNEVALFGFESFRSSFFRTDLRVSLVSRHERVSLKVLTTGRRMIATINAREARSTFEQHTVFARFNDRDWLACGSCQADWHHVGLRKGPTPGSLRNNKRARFEIEFTGCKWSPWPSPFYTLFNKLRLRSDRV